MNKNGTMKIKHITIICIIVSIVYANALFLNFVWDDIYHIQENPVVQTLSNIPVFFTSDDGEGNIAGDNPYYRPLTTTSFAVDYFLWGNNPAGFHLTNIILHILVCIMLYFFMLKLKGSPTVAFVSALLFGVHPVYQEAVVYISARADLIAAFFMISSFHFYVKYRDTECAKVVHIVLSLILFYLSLLAKIMTVTLPVLIFLYETVVNRKKTNKSLPEIMYYVIPILLFISMRFAFLERTQWYTVPLSIRLFTSAGILVSYLKMLVLPIDLKVFYDITAKEILLHTDVLVPMAVLVIIIIVLILLRRKMPMAVFAISWIIISLFPVSGLPGFIYPALMAERYLYIPAIGFCVGIGMLYEHLARHEHFRKIIVSTAVLVATIYSLTVIYRNNIWTDCITLWTVSLKNAPHDRYVINRLAVAYSEKGDYDKAENFFKVLVDAYPDAESFYNLAVVYFRGEKFDLAERYYQKALQVSPDNTRVLYGLGLVNLKQKEMKEAADAFNKILMFDPYNAMAVEALKLTQSLSLDQRVLAVN